MNRIFKNVLAVIIGWLGGSIVNMGLIELGHEVFPIAGFDLNDMNSLASLMPTLNPMYFIFPFLVLMNSDYKRIPWFIVMAGIVILIGHYLDVFNMIMPATVGDRWSVGLPELSALALFSGLFLLLVFYALSKHPLLPKGNPFIKESEHFHY